MTWPGQEVAFLSSCRLSIGFLWLFKGCVFCLDYQQTEVDGPDTIPEQKRDLHSQKGGMGSEEQQKSSWDRVICSAFISESK